MRLGNKISKRRKELGLTQQELADQLFVSVKTISKWETNRGNPEINTLPRIAEVLDINISELFDESVINDEPLNEMKKLNFFDACFSFGFAFFGLVFFFLTFVTIETNIQHNDPFFGNIFGSTPVKFIYSGYKVLFKLSGTNLLGWIFILSIWSMFFIILSHIAFGLIEILVIEKEKIVIKNKIKYIVSIVGMSSIVFALFMTLISKFSIGTGMIFMLLLFGANLGYNIYSKKNNLDI